MYLFSFTTAVRSFHVYMYKNVWEPTIAGVSFVKRFLVIDHFTWLLWHYSSVAIDDDGITITFDNGPDGWGNSVALTPYLQVDPSYPI